MGGKLLYGSALLDLISMGNWGGMVTINWFAIVLAVAFIEIPNGKSRFEIQYGM
ncbi:MAG: hypothetical protein M0R33_17880 [Methylomonas sp.]|jgi:hypothetical protein|uniref:hypothetical protein n=1 Tax=Methylomonas sp. TaxID=418 RepID=UPI0025E39764|nr:hypothetical protein [Methylomonas sp.]MCK9608318.1 hypothetical protein [Methylomonas sp.]